MKVLKIGFLFLISTVLLSSLISCGKSGIASVSCLDIERAESNLGEIATSSWSLGEVKWSLLGDGECVIQGIGATVHKDTVSKYSNVIDEGSSKIISIESKLEVQITGDFDHAPVKAEVQSKLANKSELKAYNYKRIVLDDFIRRVNEDPEIVRSVKSIYESHIDQEENLRFIGIQRVLKGDSLIFLVDKDNATSSSFDFKSKGDIDIQVNYNCTSSLGVTGDDGTLLMYQYLYLQWDPENEEIIPSSRSLNVNDCEHISLTNN